MESFLPFRDIVRIPETNIGVYMKVLASLSLLWESHGLRTFLLLQNPAKYKSLPSFFRTLEVLPDKQALPGKIFGKSIRRPILFQTTRNWETLARGPKISAHPSRQRPRDAVDIDIDSPVPKDAAGTVYTFDSEGRLRREVRHDLNYRSGIKVIGSVNDKQEKIVVDEVTTATTILRKNYIEAWRIELQQLRRDVAPSVSISELAAARDQIDKLSMQYLK